MGPTTNAAAGGDTTDTKIFVGGLAWETQHDTMRRYFEQFGEILEAVVITDKNTGRSKGYGFVTFRDPDSATRACQDPSPVIDGRRANCNLACIGALHRSRPPTRQYGIGRFPPQPSSTVLSSSAYRRPSAVSMSTAYYHQPTHYAALPLSVYGYFAAGAGYSQENMYPVNYFGVSGRRQQQQQQQFTPYYPAAAAAAATPTGAFPNYYPYYAQYTESAAQAHGGGFSLHYTQMLQYPYVPQQFGSGSAAILSLPQTSIAAPPTAGVTAAGSSMASTPSSSQPPPRTTAADQSIKASS